VQKLTTTHVRRWVEHRHRVGYGGVYQGRNKSFPLQDDAHFTTVVRCVERNPLRASLVDREHAADRAGAVAGACLRG